MSKQTVRRKIDTAVEFSDASGRAFWLRALITGDYEYKSKPITVDAEYIRLVVSETRRALKKWRDMAELDVEPYRPPVLIEHTPAGERHGEILDLKSKDVEASDEQPARTELWLKVLPTWDTEWKIDCGAFEYVSVRTRPAYVDQDGETYEVILEELSLTVNPFFKHLGKIKETMTYEMSDAKITEMALIFSDTDDEQGDDVNTEALMTKLTAIEGRLEQLEKTPAKPEIKASDEQKPATVVEPVGVTPELLKAHTEALHANTRALGLKASGVADGVKELGGGGTPPAATLAPTTVMGAIQAIMASDGVDEMTAAEISASRYPHLF